MLGWLRAWLGDPAPAREAGPGADDARARARSVVVLIDGTMTSVEPGRETSVGLMWRLLAEDPSLHVHYEPGIAWRGWRRAHEVAAGVGVNRQMRRGYLFAARHWRPGDRLFLVGYSRGAYVARALAGMIDRVGLLAPANASAPLARAAWEHYRRDPAAPMARRFAALYCHDAAAIDAVGCFDTVRAVGARWPVLWRVLPPVHAFRSHRLGAAARVGLHALALHETRRAFAPELWETAPGDPSRVEQMWFRGAHPDVGGQVAARPAARPLSNVALRWMLEGLAAEGLPLPEGWRARFPADPDAPMVGTWRGWGPVFLARRRRVVGRDPSERIHDTARRAAPATPSAGTSAPPR